MAKDEPAAEGVATKIKIVFGAATLPTVAWRAAGAGGARRGVGLQDEHRSCKRGAGAGVGVGMLRGMGISLVENKKGFLVTWFQSLLVWGVLGLLVPKFRSFEVSKFRLMFPGIY